ncbi:MAG: universal stress protein [Deltaproteobacteria bacterium]|nr:universal stress protein [Deltaproteobacteria bacterium]
MERPHDNNEGKCMIVIAALNGTLTSDTAAHYALRYCSVYRFDLHLLHVRNDTDPIEPVMQSMKNIEMEALRMEIKVECALLEGQPLKALKAYVRKKPVDILFCSTPATRRFFLDSFSDKVTRIRIGCDVAVVRIASLESARRHSSLMLSIRDARLSVQKFVFFASLAKAYEIPAEVYSVSVMSWAALAKLDRASIKESLRNINQRLGHYQKLAELADFKFRLKHSITTRENPQIVHHALRVRHDLVVVGGARLKFMAPFRGTQPIEQLMRQTPVNLIAYYPRKGGHD